MRLSRTVELRVSKEQLELTVQEAVDRGMVTRRKFKHTASQAGLDSRLHAVAQKTLG